MSDSTDKTVAEVADKALDKVSSALGAMAEAAKKIAPHAWEIMMRQQIIEGLVNLGTVLVCAIAVAFYVKWASKGWSEKGGSYDPFGLSGGAFFRALTSAVLGIAIVTAFLTVVPEAAMQVANPEYYAIKTLLGNK